MSKLNRWLVTSLLLILALISYALGSVGGFAVFLVFGAVFELMFWINLFGKKA